MKYNAILDVQRSEGGTAAGSSFQLTTVSQSAIEGQTVFQFDELIGATLLLFFVDGSLFEPVETIDDITPEKNYFFDPATGSVSVFNGQDANTIVSALYVSGGTATFQPEPVTLQEVKDWCRIDVADDDDLITMLITAAREACEDYTNISFILRTVTARILNQLGDEWIPYGPVGDIVSFVNNAGDTVATDQYIIRGVQFKQLCTRFCEPVTIQYAAGYSILPKKLKTALLNQIAWMYTNRGDEALKSGMSDLSRITLNNLRRA
jgi:uncharacterized phiE125 gp8 family phage protein